LLKSQCQNREHIPENWEELYDFKPKEDIPVTNYHDWLFEDEESKRVKEKEAHKLVQRMQEDRQERERKKGEDHEKLTKKILYEQSEIEEKKREWDEKIRAE